MGVRRLNDLIAYQLAISLHRWVLDFSTRPNVARNRKFCEQLTDASGGICRNVAEGFARWTRRDFHNFLRVARASHVETEMLLDDAVLRGYLTSAERREVGPLLGRCGKAIAALMRSLRDAENGPARRV